MKKLSELKNKKIIVIGSPGSGKSYFSKILSEKTGIKKFHLDCIYWQENWVSLPKDQFLIELEKIMTLDSWIIDGNYSSTLELRMNQADTIFFLDISVDVCIASEALRRGKKREDIPSFLEEEYDPIFIEFIKKFPEKERCIIIELLAKYQDKEIIIFTTRDEVNKYLCN